MACNQTLSGLPQDCEPSRGGIRKIAVANFSDVSSITTTDGIVTAIEMVEGAKFHLYELPKQTASFTSPRTIDRANASNFVTTDLTLQFNKMSTAKRIEMEALSAIDARVLALDANGKWWLLGDEEPVNATANEGTTGTAIGDANRYTLTMQDVSSHQPYEVDAKIVDALIA